MADTIHGDPSVQILCDCGEAFDIVPAIADRFRRHTICHQVVISLYLYKLFPPDILTINAIAYVRYYVNQLVYITAEMWPLHVGGSTRITSRKGYCEEAWGRESETEIISSINNSNDA